MASLSRDTDNGDLNFVFHVYYYTALSITYNISRSISLYRLCSSHKLVHNIDRLNKWFSTLWRHYDVIIILVKFLKYFTTHPKWLSLNQVVIRPCILPRYHVNLCTKWMLCDQLWTHCHVTMEMNLFLHTILLLTILSNLQYEWSYIPLPFLFFA